MTNMNKIYTNYRGCRKGKDKGAIMVYHISVPAHRGIHQGYIGQSSLNEEGLRQRYLAETEESITGQRKKRRVLQMLNKYSGKWKITPLATGMTREEARDLEKRLRPFDNKGENFCMFNWNEKAGG